ncbi:MAG TPA: restriction endonuclease PLD domain-containing protein, partial [Anaerolineales bacterium]|nr:restriction endonuclease PLD domain-containing protein [Anaerolineales bacterium]
MITDNLFDSLLVEPALQAGANKLYIVSGYATSAMAFHHIDNLGEKGIGIQVKLIVGMCGQDGLSISNHRGFQQLMGADFAGKFECSYLVNTIPVHSKVYAWFRDENPVIGFTGSANYTQKAFGNNQKEAMAESSPKSGLEYFHSLIEHTIYCVHTDAENLIQIYNDKFFARQRREIAQQEDKNIPAPAIPELAGLESVRVSLLDFRDPTTLPARSGLNWGQRPEEHREPNQAYIHLPASIYRTSFFPPKTVHFTVLTDDGRVLTCTRAQEEYGKAIHTPQNNSLIGEYFRNRLG